MVEEAYILDYTLFILVANVEFLWWDWAKFAKALENSTVVSKYYMGYIAGAWILVGTMVFATMAFAAWDVKVGKLNHFLV